MKKTVVEAKWSSANGGKARIDAKKSDAVCVVGLERNRSLRATGQTIDFNLYCQQLERLCQAIERKQLEFNQWSIGKASFSIITTSTWLTWRIIAPILSTAKSLKPNEIKPAWIVTDFPQHLPLSKPPVRISQ